jgi:minor histocompatibility antigen H13
MVTVAKAIDSPLKLVIPTSLSGDYSAVGLGDIVIPGLMASLTIRIDLIKAYLTAK